MTVSPMAAPRSSGRCRARTRPSRSSGSTRFVRHPPLKPTLANPPFRPSFLREVCAKTFLLLQVKKLETYLERYKERHKTSDAGCQVNPATWTVLQQDGPNHLGLW